MTLLGLALSPSAADGADPVRDARRAEDLGFDFVSTSDHPCGTDPTFEVWTMLTWVAAKTTRIRIATRVLGVPYRPPAMVAKMAESLDRLSGGRLILGVGGGYSDDEFRAFGLNVPSPRDKVDGMAEAIDIARGLWSQPNFSYQGRIFYTDGADLSPRPGHRIPIWTGAYGPRALEVTGRLADGWIPSYGFAPPDQIVGLRDTVLAAARAAGRDPGEITYAYNVPVFVGAASADAGVISGPAEHVAERLVGLTRLGFNALNLTPTGPNPREQVELIARDVVPELRSDA